MTGGASLMPGIEVLAEKVLRQTVRVAEPELSGLPEALADPRYATSVGLLMQGGRYSDSMQLSHGWGVKSLFRKVKVWLEEHL